MNTWRSFFEKLRRRMHEYSLLAFLRDLQELALRCGLYNLSLLLDWWCLVLVKWGEMPAVASAPVGQTASTERHGAVAFSPTEDSLAYAVGRRVRLLSLLNRSFLYYEGHRDLVTSIAWSPDGRYLASASLDGTVQVWEAASARPCFPSLQHQCPVRVVAWSPDGARLASAGADGSLRIWNASEGDQPRVASVGYEGALTTLAWSPDGSCLLSGGADGMVCLWDPENVSAIDRWSAHERLVSAVAWCPDPDRLLFATAGHDGIVKVWSAEWRSCLFVYMGHTRAAGSPGPTGVVAVAWTLNGRRIISADLGETVQEWTPVLDERQALVTISVPVASLAFRRAETRVDGLDVRTLQEGLDEIVTEIAVVGDGWVYVGPSPADPRAMFGDISGGRLQPLYAADGRRAERGN